MPANECIPFKEPGSRVTATTTAAVTGKHAVAISGDLQDDGTYSVALPTAGGRIFGIAAYDAPEGGRVPVIRTPGIILPVTAAAAVTAGSQVEVDATGAVVPLTTGAAIGTALTGADADEDAIIALFT